MDRLLDAPRRLSIISRAGADHLSTRAAIREMGPKADSRHRCGAGARASAPKLITREMLGTM